MATKQAEKTSEQKARIRAKKIAPTVKNNGETQPGIVGPSGTLVSGARNKYGRKRFRRMHPKKKGDSGGPKVQG